MSYLVLARKWRPKVFEDLIGQEGITRILSNAISQGRIAHAYIFSGPRGVGKTSTARILAKALNCGKGPGLNPCGSCLSCIAVTDGTSMDVMEIDGASNNGVDAVRDLRERVKYVAAGGGYKVYIIDEAHMLSDAAFNALLKTLEEPPSHVVFVLATTVPRKIPATVLSRCQHLPFKKIPGHKIKERLKMISASENINISDDAIELIARAAEGSMRDSLTILDQVSAFSSDINASEIKDLLGIADFAALAELSVAVINGDREKIVAVVSGLADRGTDLRGFSKDLMGFFRDLLVVKVASKPEEILDITENEMSVMRGIAKDVSEDHMTILLSEIAKAESEVRLAFSPRVAFEMALVRTSFLNTLRPLNEALGSIEEFLKDSDHTEKGRGVAPAGAAKSATSIKTPAPQERKAEAVLSEPPPDAEPEPPGSDIEDSYETAPDTHGDAVQDEVTSVITRDFPWESIVRKIDESNHPLAGKLSVAEAGIDGDTIHVFFNGGVSVHIDSVKKNIKTIENTASEILGKKVSVRIEAKKKEVQKKRDIREKMLSEPIVKGVIDLFDGRIVEMKHNENIPNGGKDV